MTDRIMFVSRKNPIRDQVTFYDDYHSVFQAFRNGHGTIACSYRITAIDKYRFTGTLQWSRNVAEELRQFARWCVLYGDRFWPDMPAVVRWWLETGNRSAYRNLPRDPYAGKASYLNDTTQAVIGAYKYAAGFGNYQHWPNQQGDDFGDCHATAACVIDAYRYRLGYAVTHSNHAIWLESQKDRKRYHHAESGMWRLKGEYEKTIPSDFNDRLESLILPRQVVVKATPLLQLQMMM